MPSNLPYEWEEKRFKQGIMLGDLPKKVLRKIYAWNSYTDEEFTADEIPKEVLKKIPFDIINMSLKSYERLYKRLYPYRKGRWEGFKKGLLPGFLTGVPVSVAATLLGLFAAKKFASNKKENDSLKFKENEFIIYYPWKFSLEPNIPEDLELELLNVNQTVGDLPKELLDKIWIEDKFTGKKEKASESRNKEILKHIKLLHTDLPYLCVSEDYPVVSKF